MGVAALAIASVVGAVSGLGGALFARGAVTPNRPEDVPSSDSARPRAERWSYVSRPPSSSPDLGRLAQRVDLLESKARGESAQPEPDLDIEQSRQKRQEVFTARIAAHDREPRDPAWSKQTAESIESELTAVADGFAVHGVTCGMTTCTAKVRWPTYLDATSSFSTLLHLNYSANCAREILLPEPEDPAATYDGTLLFDCEAWRAGDE